MKLVLRSPIRLGTTVLLVTLASIHAAFGQEILSAAGAGDTTTVARLLEVNPDAVNTRDSFSKRTPLHFATEKDHLDVAELLLKKGADINAQDYMGLTALHWAVDRQHKDIVEFLLANKARVDLQDEQGQTPLHLTVWNRNADLAELLISHGAPLDAKNKDGATVILSAAANGRRDLFDLLLAKGAKFTDKTIPLHRAVQNGHLETVNDLLAHGADVNAGDDQGTRVLHTAAKACRIDIVETLLAHGADINIKDKDGQTPMDRFAQSSCRDAKLAKLLREHGAQMSIWGATGLGAYEDVVNLLKQDRHLVAARDHGGQTPLHIAAGSGHPSIVQLLLREGADVNATERGASTPLHLADREGFLEIAKQLLEYKPAINATNEAGRTPLHYASLSTNVAVLKLLLANHAEVNAKDRRSNNPPYLGRGGRTPLHYAAGYRRTDVAEILLAAGADVNAQDDEGMTPLHVVLSEPPVFVDFAGTPEGRKGAEQWAQWEHDAIKAFVDVLLAHKANVNYEEKEDLAKLGVKRYLDEIVMELTTTNSPLFDAYKKGSPVALSDARATRFSDDPGIYDIQTKAFVRLAYIPDRSTVKIVAAFLYSPQEMRFVTDDIRQQPPSWFAIWALRLMVDNPPQSDDVKIWQQWWEENKHKYP